MRRPDIIPAGWAAAHRPVAAATMTAATCQIRHADTIDTDPTTGQVTRTPGAIVLDGSPCRVQAIEQGQRNDTPLQQLITNTYLLALPYTDAALHPGQIVEILTSDDTRLTGRTFTITAEHVGSLVWERDLFMVDNESRD